MAYVRKTEDEWQIHGNFDGKWEEVCSESCWKDARRTLREYRENDPTHAYKVKKVRVPKN